MIYEEQVFSVAAIIRTFGSSLITSFVFYKDIWMCRGLIYHTLRPLHETISIAINKHRKDSIYESATS